METKSFNPKIVNPEIAPTKRIQPKLEVNPPNDIYEKQADEVADKVSRMPANTSDSLQMQPKEDEDKKLQMKPEEETSTLQMQPEDEDKGIQMKPEEDDSISMKSEEEEKGKIQMSSNSMGGQNVPQVSPGLTSQLNSTKGQGSPLPNNVSKEMGQKIGGDFSSVRVHTNDNAVQMNKELGAKAFTHGNNIYFNKSNYNPDSSSGKQLLAHELTHTVQQSKGTIQANRLQSNSQMLQCDLESDIRTESQKMPKDQTPGLLGKLETSARTEADSLFQVLTGKDPLPEGATGRATQIIEHVKNELIRLESARSDGYGQAVSSIIGQLTLNKDQTASFWTAFAGNTLWALSGLVPLLGPVIGVSKIALAAGGGVLLRTNAIGSFLKSGGGNVASSIVGLVGAEMAQFSGGLPSSSSNLPSTIDEIQTTFSKINSRVMNRYRSEAHALTLGFLKLFDFFISPENAKKISADFLENFTKGCIMEALLFDLNQEGIINTSNYTIDTGKAQEYAKEHMMNRITDTWFTNQIKSIGLGARAGVLQIKLASRYPDKGWFKIEGGNIVGEGSDIELLRTKLANRKLKDIEIPKVIRMNGDMGMGIMDCNWNIEVHGQVIRNYPTISATKSTSPYEVYNETSQHVERISGQPDFGLPWLAAYNLGLNDLSSSDPKFTKENMWTGALKVWDEIKDMKPGTIDNSSW